ncbi:NAC domain-containing protein [Melia azedarach]|uniref:NAC domain-containing protein n=1 Tax=Melia azedarach TaxID=155640 RepID=A0ACC1XE01_MELAZ|nr:NAC domain-containing protein [Melia azedarach]
MVSPAITASSSWKHANESDRNANNLSKISNSLLADDSIKWGQKVAVGIRFNPNDEVLASHYVAGKSCGSTNGPIFSLIKEVDVYQHDPSDLSSLAYDFGKGKMYFFTPLNKKSEVPVPSGGYWKKTREPTYVEGKDRNPIASKNTLV